MGDIDSYVERELEFDLTSEDEATRRNALQLLAGSTWDGPLLERFKRIASEDSSPELRYLAKKHYNRIKEGLSRKLQDQFRVVVDGVFDPAALSSAMAAPEATVRLEALRQVIEARPPEASPLLRSALAAEQDNWVVASLVKAVGACGTAEQLPLLRGFLGHSDTRVVANAVEALESIGGSDSVAILVSMLDHPDHRVRGNAVKALLATDHRRALTEVARMSRSEQEGVRDAALYCLGVLDPADAEPLAIEMLASESYRELLKKEGEFLAKILTQNGLPQVFDIQRTPVRERLAVASFVIDKTAERLGLSESKLQSIRADAARANPSIASATSGVVRTLRRPISTRKLATPPPPPPTAMGRARALLLRSPLATAAGVLLTVGGAVSAIVGHSRTGEVSVALALSATSDIAQASRAESSAAVAGRSASFAGKVIAVQSQANQILVSSGSRLVLVRASEGKSSAVASMKRGQIVQVRGKITGRTRVGGVYVDMTSAEAVQ